MSAPAPYRFDGVFALEADGQQEPPRITEEQLERVREEARSQAYAEGHAAGREQAMAEQEAHINHALSKVLDQLPGLVREADRHMRETEDGAVEIAIITARKLARALIAKFPLVEIVNLLRQSFDEIRRTPHVVLHVHEELSDAMADRIGPLTSQSGIEGRVIVMGDPDIPPGDARIEWADGGMVRDLAGIETRIDEAIKRFVMSHRTIEPGQTPAAPQPSMETPR